MGVEKNVFWTEKAQHAVFDAMCVNHLPALDNNVEMQEQAAAFGYGEEDAAAPSPQPQRLMYTYVIPGGTVKAFATDTEGLVGLTVRVPRTFW
mmetsp:Transcript_47754/g.95337  ORF Transcript_47754/g.95337 Transcript_47754/m.95337 type:complete len:93 (+) Transcript_47754:1032-1310(+)